MYCTVDEPSKMTPNDGLYICRGSTCVGYLHYKDGNCTSDTRYIMYPIFCPDTKETKLRKFKVYINEVQKMDEGEWYCKLNSTGTVSNMLKIKIICK